MADRHALRIALVPPDQPDTVDDIYDTVTDDDGYGIGVELEQVDELDGVDPCADTSGLSLVVGVRAYVNPADLNYSMTITHGTLSDGEVVDDSEYSEMLTFMMSDTVTMRRPITNPSFTWEGPVLNESGEQIAAPSVSVDGATITVAVPVYGTLMVTGTERYVLYEATIPARTDGDPEKAFDSKVIAIWSGGLDELVISTPNTDDCRRDWEVDPDDELCYVLEVTVDPCTGDEQGEGTLTRASCDG